MQINTEFIADYLRIPQLYREQAEEARSKALALEEAATKTTSQITGMPHGGNNDRNMLLSQLADAREVWSDRALDLVCAVDEARDFIDRCPLSDGQNKMLKLRYIYNLPWKEVLGRLANYGINSESQMYRKHTEALEICAEEYMKGNHK